MVGGTRTRRALARSGAALALLVTAAMASPHAAGAAQSGVPSAPDYVITSVSNPPATAAPGDSFGEFDTVKNQGTADGGVSSQDLFYLSTDTTVDGTDTVLGGRGILPLAPGASSSGGLNAHIPPGMATGSYYVIICADGSNSIAELDETNNCAASASKITITLPDYRVTALTEPPADGQRGMAFGVTDTTKNVAAVGTATTTFTYYYFSKNTKLDAGDVNFGGRGLFGLAAHASNTGGLSAHVPSDLAPGSYYMLACADAAAALTESNENNNCLHSTGRMNVTVPDYYVPAVGSAPAEAARGAQFSFSDQVRNKGADAPFETQNYYYLSKDVIVDASDVQFAFTQSLAPLARGASSFDVEQLTVPNNAKLGFFHIIVCSDATNLLGEADETNNCRATPGKVHIIASQPTRTPQRVR